MGTKVGNGWLCDAITTGAGDILEESMIDAADSVLEAFVVNIVCWAPTNVMAFVDDGASAVIAALTRTGMVILAKQMKINLKLEATATLRIKKTHFATALLVRQLETRTSSVM